MTPTPDIPTDPPTTTRRYGWRRGLPSRASQRIAFPPYPPLPPKVSLIDTGFLPPIWDQGPTGSCTGHGTARAIMFARAKSGKALIDLSRLFPYWNARVREKSQDSDSGAVIADVIRASRDYGDCPYDDLPTDPDLVTIPPSASAFSDALLHRTLSATRVWGKDAEGLAYHARHCIAVLGLPVVFGFTVYDSFESDEVAKSGVVPIPSPSESVLGGHCVVMTGYDDTDGDGYVTCDNSWGEGWGAAGRFRMPYAYAFDPDLTDDFHAVVLGD